MGLLARLLGAYKIYRYAAVDGRTPLVAKVLPWAALLYLVSPLDFIPDFIPLLGQVDDILIVPMLILIAMGLIPKDVKRDAKAQRDKNVIDIEPRKP
jgi:uncharacterized membrane protein YkvA (DUF1232 family)